MRKITLLFMLLSSFATFSQSKADIKRHAGHSKGQEELKNSGKVGLETDKKAFVGYRLITLAAYVKINFEGERNNQAIKMFAEQYDKLQPAYDKYVETKSDGAKVDLLRIIIENEEEFRAFLTPEEKLAYLRYGDGIVRAEFDDSFMSDYTLAKYKKEVE